MNKVVILPRKNENNLYHILPLIKGLEIYFDGMDEAYQIHIVHSSDLNNQAALIKNRCSFHKIDEDELGPLKSLKLAERLKDLFNLTHSFCFRDDIGSLSLQKFLKAKKRYGYSSIQGKIANNNFFENYESLAPKDLYAKPLADFFRVQREEVLNLLSKEMRRYKPEVENFFKAPEVEPFVLKIFEELALESEHLLLVKTLVKDLHKKTYLWLEKENEASESLFKEHSGLLNISEASSMSFDAYLEKCLGVVTDKAWVAEMAAFFGVDVILFDAKDYRLDDFINDNVTVVKTKGPGSYIIEYQQDQQFTKEVTIDGLNDFIFQKFNL